MGAACCVADRDRTIINRSSSEVLQRNVRYSPSWSFRWDNRRRVAGEETSVSLFSHGVRSNDGLEDKPGTPVETVDAWEGNSMDSFQSLMPHMSPVSERNAGILRLSSSDKSSSSNVSIEVKGLPEPPVVLDPFPAKLSPSVRSISSVSTSPLSSQRYVRASSTPSQWSYHSPGHQLSRQVSDNRVPAPDFSISKENSFLLPGWRNEPTMGSNTSSERWSFDSESVGFNREKTRSSNQLSASTSFVLQSCGVCSKLLTERSSWGSQKIISTNELAVVAILICGHVYHAECLENMTQEIHKYDPCCPVCTFGKKQAMQSSEKLLRAEINLRAKNKRSRSLIARGDLEGDSCVFDGQQCSGHEGKSLKMISSSSMKNSSGKPFLRRHFSFGSKGTRSLSENQFHPTRKKGFLGSKSIKE